LVDKGFEKESIRLEEGVGCYSVLESGGEYRGAPGSLNRAVIQEIARDNLWSTKRMDLARRMGVDSRDELIQLWDKRSAFADGAVDETEASVEYVECGAQSVVSIGARDMLDFAGPLDPAQPLQTFSNDSFFVVDLFGIPDVLPVAASFGFV